MKKRSVLLKLFFSTLYLSAFTFGGGYAAMIEYINGIEVIKAFNQSRTSYARLVDKVKANAQYYYDWMRRSQLGMSMAYAFFPAQMLTVLPLGRVFYTHGTLTAEVSITVIILSLGMSAPIAAAFNFVDTLAQVGTTVAQVDEILNAEEQVHSETPVTFFRPYRRAQRRPLRLPCGSGDPPRRQPDHTAKQNDGAGRPVRRRKIDHCQARRGLLGRRLRQLHPQS